MKKRKHIFHFLWLLALLFLIAVPVQAAPKNKLVRAKDGYTYFYNSKGKITRSKLVTYKKKTYGFDKQGHMYKGTLFTLNGKTYHATSSGAISKNKFVTVDGRCYFFNSSGVRIGKQINVKTPNTQSSLKKLAMKNIRQKPQLPTGCESVALTMVLKYYKFNLSKTTIASRYLPRSRSGNFVTAFAGNPFSYSGCGIYSPGLAKTANKYLTAKKSKLKAYDITGTTLSNLYNFIDEGTPVIVWNSMYMRNPIPSFSYRTLGKRWTFYAYEHCVVLCGYDKKKNKVLINDPLSGLVWRKKSSFERIYNKMGKMAVVIR